MDVGGSKGGIKADINVTPLVDVMLVLLIIMMLVAPLLNRARREAAAGRQHAAETVDEGSDRRRDWRGSLLY
jgi:biopolymer transport protein ExbD